MNIVETFNKLNPHNPIKNFDELEIQKRPIPEELKVNIFPTLAVLNKVRTDLGLPIKIDSVYRDEKYNESVGGKSNSLHLVANAIDFKVKDFDYNLYANLFIKLRTGKYNIGVVLPDGEQVLVTEAMLGVGLYDTFIHLDTRGFLGRPAPVKWYGRK